MRLFFMVVALFFGLSNTSAQMPNIPGVSAVQMKKAHTQGQKDIDVAIGRFKQNCGNEKIVVKSEHLKAASLNYADRSPDNLVQVAGNLCADIVGRIGDICTDPDYKEAISKITLINCKPQKIDKRPYATMQVKGQTISIAHDAIQYDQVGLNKMIKNSL